MDDNKQTTPRKSDEAPLPGFLTREEYEQVGDDPDPLPRNFEVIEGTGAQSVPNSATTVEDMTTKENVEITTEAVIKHEDAVAIGAPHADSDQEKQGAGSFFAQGAEAVRQVSAAKKAHDTARDELDELDGSISEREAELSHRRDIAARYEQIIRDETERKEEAKQTTAKAQKQQEALQLQIEQLKTTLQHMKDDDAQTEKRLKVTAEAAEAKEASARESGARLQRRLDDAKRSLKKAEEDRGTGIAAARKSIESAAQRLQTLQDEYDALQRTPSANTAEYSVRTAELQTEIADAANELQSSQADLPRIKAEVEQNVVTAQALVSEAEKPIDAARQTLRAATAEADKARDELDCAKREASKRQRELRDQISKQEKALREQVKVAEEADNKALEAQAALDEAHDIHAHPEVADQLAADLEQDRKLRVDKASQVKTLADAEKAVRATTRSSRYKFLGTIAAAVILVLAIVLWLIFAPK